MRPLVIIPIFLILLSLFLEVAESEPRFIRFRFRLGRRARYRRRYNSCRPVNCAVNNWSRWGHCSQSCGPSGVQSRHRHITRSQKCGGRCSYPLQQSRPCNRFCLHGGFLAYNKYCRCKYGNYGKCCERGRRVNGRWSGWSKWARCSKTCGYGRKYRTRSCTNPRPSYGGRRCSGSSRQSRSCYIRRSCTVNGRWSGWGKWSRCSKTCGYGRKYRSRSCTNPRPSYGGRRCYGISRQSQKCYIRRRCTVNGRWSGWGKWSRCSKTCGYGLKYRSRSCTNPRPSYGGRRCYGISRQSQKCYIRRRCPVNGRWSGWGKWSRCSKTCGYGLKYRRRSCTNPRPSYGGRRCYGISRQSQKCYIRRRCPVNGRWSGWGKWSRCSKTCGYGRKYRSRSCTNPRPSYGGRRCYGISRQSQKCYIRRRCPVNGRWSGWGKWSRCSKTCGYGRKYRSRSCTNPRPSYGGRRCYGISRQSQKCYIRRRCPVNGRWSGWGKWSRCSKTCGYGRKYRSRSCTNPRPSYGGRRCYGISRQSQKCYIRRRCPVNGRWSGWGKWSRCSKTCGYGRKYRSRSCTNPRPSYGGRRCYGISRQSQKCYIRRRCPVNGRWSGWGKWSRCSKTCGYGRKYRSRSCTNPRPSYGGRRCYGISRQSQKCYIRRRCPVNGRWSGWGKWSRCSKTCGYGLKYRSRSCTNPRPSYGGRRCYGISRQSQKCYIKRRCPVNGRWSGWGKWSRCSKTCGYGRKYRSRSCTNPRPSYGGRRCYGISRQSQKCYIRRRCPVNGRWSGWGKWSRCSKTCGYGRKYRSRSCTNPRPSYGGRRCYGISRQSQGCYIRRRCPVNGRWSGWGKWSRCSKTCGYGRKYRTRSCTNPRSSYGGRRCYGISRQSQGCYIKRWCSVRVNGGWSKWSKWSAASKTCGIGLKHRTRSCTNPRPANNGRRCYGNSKQYMTVFQGRCKVNGGWSRWGAWSKCSKSCGSGLQVRKRYCTKPRPAYGGRSCSGKSREIRTCHLTQCIHYSHKGCFGDSRSRAMPILLKNLAYGDAVAKCAKLAYSRKYKCFGLQNGGECWSGSNAHRTYNEYGESPNQCKNGKGGSFANDVYCFRGVPGAPTQPPKTPPPTTEGPKPTQQDCWSEWVYSDCTKPCGCGFKARTRFCKCGAGKYGSCKGLRMETFKCNCHQCGPPIDA